MSTTIMRHRVCNFTLYQMYRASVRKHTGRSLPGRPLGKDACSGVSADMPILTRLEDDPLWYKDAIIYEVHVRAFFDHNGDGMGDFGGLTQKLDYLQDLGVTAIWVLPFCPSPWRDDGYDISDYTECPSGVRHLARLPEFPEGGPRPRACA